MIASISRFRMRPVAALTIVLLVAVLAVTAAQEVRSHRKVLQDVPSAVNETMATIAEGMNATKAANATGNATDNRSRRGGGGGSGWGSSDSGNAPVCGSISCLKRRLMAANETSAVNATAANATNVTSNSSDTRSRRGGGFREGADSYSGPGTYNTFTQADQVAAGLGLGGAKKLLAEPAAVTEVMNATTASNATGNATANATDNRSRRGGGSGWGGSNSGNAPVCPDSISCRKRKLMAVNETATTMKGINATTAGNATGNATDNRSRRGGGGGSGWGSSDSGNAPICGSISCLKRRLMAANESSAVNATAANATNVTGNSSDTRSRRGGGFREGADSYSGPGTYNTFTQADQVAAGLGLGGAKKLLAEPAAVTEVMNATKAANATGNATDNRSREGGGDGWGGSPSGLAVVCGSISCLKRRLMQATNVSTADLATTDGMEPALHSNATTVNATMTSAMNATGNSTDSRSRVGHLQGNDWGEGGGPSQPRTQFGV